MTATLAYLDGRWQAAARTYTVTNPATGEAIKIKASVLTTDPWEEACQVLPNVNTLTKNAAKQAYEQAGVAPEDLDLVELHDCFATAELVHYDNLMLCPEGGAVDFFLSGATWRDGKTPVNVSGGLESKGHPIGATGIANIWEVCHHLRGEAGDRHQQAGDPALDLPLGRMVEAEMAPGVFVPRPLPVRDRPSIDIHGRRRRS